MSLLVANGKIVTSGGKFLLKITAAPPAGNTIFIGYSDLALGNIGLQKSIDSGANFAVDASVPLAFGEFSCAAKDTLNNSIWFGTNQGYVYSYNLLTNTFDSSLNVIAPQPIYDIQINGSVRAVGSGLTITLF